MVRKQLDNIYKNIERQAIRALEETGHKIRVSLENYIITEIYQTYSPKVYERTMDLLNSTRLTPVRKEGNKYYITIYISNELHSSPSWYDNPIVGIHKGDYAPLSSIIEAFERGLTRERQPHPVVTKTYQEWVETGKALRQIQSYLSREFNIK